MSSSMAALLDLNNSDDEDAHLDSLAQDAGLSGLPSAQRPKTKTHPQVRSSDDDNDGDNNCSNGHQDSSGPPATQSAGKEVKLEELQALEKELMETKARLAQIQELIKTTTGSVPNKEKYAFNHITEALDLRLKAWKVKIEEGVSTNQEVIVLDNKEEDPEPIQLPSFKRKHGAPNDNCSNTVTKKSKTGPSSSSDSGDEDKDQNTDTSGRDQNLDASGRPPASGVAGAKGKQKAMDTEQHNLNKDQVQLQLECLEEYS